LKEYTISKSLFGPILVLFEVYCFHHKGETYKKQLSTFNMSFSLNFMSTSHYIDTSLKAYTEGLLSLINTASQLNTIDIKTLKFQCGKLFDLNSEVNLHTIINNRIPVFDLIIYMNLSDESKKKVSWIVDDSRPSFSESQIAFSSLFIYFMLMTRNKAFPERNENIPNYLAKFMTIPMTTSDIKRCLSENNLNLFQHDWIKNIKINLLSISLKNRLKQGIAGMRLFTIIRDHEPDKNVNSNISSLISRLKILVNEGPYWEMHTLFQSTFLSSSSINANLNNLILEIYTPEKIKELVENRSLYKYPVFNPRALSYRTWSDNFFNEFKSKINFE
jgi:hypothetical protein